MQVTNFRSPKNTIKLAVERVSRESGNSFGTNSDATPRYAERYPLGRRKTQGNAHQDSDRLEEQTDEAVFAAFITGDTVALGILYDRYGLLVYRLIYRMVGSAQEAEDLTQEIFLNLQVKAKFDPQRGSFYTYLMMLTRSRTIDRLRSKRSKGRFWQNIGKLKDSIQQHQADTPMEFVTIKERAALVKDALRSLSSNQRQVLELSYYEGLSQAEIAERLNIPLGTVKTHSRRGLLQLRKNLHNLVN